jgi:hypothetical protein
VVVSVAFAGLPRTLRCGICGTEMVWLVFEVDGELYEGDEVDNLQTPGS